MTSLNKTVCPFLLCIALIGVILTHMAHIELIGSNEAARRLGMSRSNFQRKVTAGEIPAVAKLPGLTAAYLFDPKVIDNLGTKGRA